MTNPVFSIITPMWKGAELVGTTIESVIAQTFTDWEMIIVDDASPDNGAGCKVVQSYADKDTRIKLIAAEVNKGSSGARNEAMRNAKGRYLAFLDSDDIWHSEYLETMKKHIDECNDKTVAIYFSGYRRMNENCTREILEPFSCPRIENKKTMMFHDPIFPSAAIIDTLILPKKVFFREELRNLRDDWVFWLDIMDLGFRAQGYSDILVDYRMRGDSLTSSKKKMIKPHWNVYRKVLKCNPLVSLFCISVWMMGTLKKYGKYNYKRGRK